ncbi:MAG: MTH865 family protein [bacterium]
MGTDEELRRQMLNVFQQAEYPISSPMDLLSVLPDGPSTTFEANDFSITAMEMNTKGADKADFPYDSAEAFVDDIIEGLKEEDLIE